MSLLPRRVAQRFARLAAASVLGLIALGPVAAPALAADPVLSRPSAAAHFLKNITFTGTATLPGPVRRLEIVIDVEGATRSIVDDIGLSRADGRTDLEYVLETPAGGIAPNTDVTARFRATLDDGTLVDGPSATVHYEDTRYDWQTLRGDPVTVHWTEGGLSFGRRALRIANDAVARMSKVFGVSETEPIDFYVYADSAAFYDVLGPAERGSLAGLALPEIRTLFATIRPDQVDDAWVGAVLPHELTHLVVDSVIRNPYHDPPIWLDEGVAVYFSEGYGVADRGLVRDAISNGTLLPLRALGGERPTSSEQLHLAYAEYASAVAFLVREYGQQTLVRLVRSYADGITDDEAFTAALGTDVAGFEAAWLDDLGVEAPRPYGPVEAPPGPVPSDWLGEGTAPGYLPEATGSPEPTSAAAAGKPGTGQGDGLVTALASLIVLGLAIAGVGVLVARRTRRAATSPATIPGSDGRLVATWSESQPGEPMATESMPGELPGEEPIRDVPVSETATPSDPASGEPGS